MEKTIEIPKGYEARIEGNKVVIEKKDKKIIKAISIEGAKWADANPSLPSNLDEVARFGGLNYVDTIPEGGTDMHPWNDTDVERAYEEGMKAGVEWMAGQISKAE